MNSKQIDQIREHFQQNEKVCEKVMDILSLVSNKTRFRILCALNEGDFCVKDIVEMIRMGKISNISQQLRLLTMAGIVERYRDRKQVIYHLKDEKIKKMIGFLEEHYLNV